MYCRYDVLPCWWCCCSHGLGPWEEVGCQTSASRSSPEPRHAWRLSLPCLVQLGLRSGAHWAARSDGLAPTSGQCCPGPTTVSWWPASARRCSKYQTQIQHLYVSEESDTLTASLNLDLPPKHTSWEQQVCPCCTKHNLYMIICIVKKKQRSLKNNCQYNMLNGYIQSCNYRLFHYYLINILLSHMFLMMNSTFVVCSLAPKQPCTGAASIRHHFLCRVAHRVFLTRSGVCCRGHSLCNRSRAVQPRPAVVQSKYSQRCNQFFLTFQSLSTSLCLLLSGFTQIRIEPAAEAILLVPGALSVADQH